MTSVREWHEKVRQVHYIWPLKLKPENVNKWSPLLLTPKVIGRIIDVGGGIRPGEDDPTTMSKFLEVILISETNYGIWICYDILFSRYSAQSGPTSYDWSGTSELDLIWNKSKEHNICQNTENRVNFDLKLDLQSIGSSPDLQTWLIRARQIQWSELGIWTWDISLTP